MDEVFGYFPPTANPPAKTPMLTLLKQARAYGLGVVLATQNPVDLDYKGLSNTGTWLLGRLQTERDKARVIDGLEGAAAGAHGFNRPAMERTLAGLGSRVFLLHNVHDDAPVVFHTRWALSYLAGPMTRAQIKRLQPPRDDGPTDDPHAAPDDVGSPERAATDGAPRPRTSTGTYGSGGTLHGTHPSDDAPPSSARTTASPTAGTRPEREGTVTGTAAAGPRPVLPPGVPEGFLPLRRPLAAGDTLVYRPALLAGGTVHFADAGKDVDEWSTVTVVAPLPPRLRGSPWKDASESDGSPPELDDEPMAPARFAELPAAATDAKQFPRWAKMLRTHLGRTRTLTLFSCRTLKAMSTPGQTEGEFRIRLRELAREARDRDIERLRARYTPQLERLQDRIRAAEARVAAEQSQLRQQKTQTMISVGATVLGALFGRKAASVGTVGRATTAMRGAGRTMRERGDVSRAVDNVETLRDKLAALDAELEDKLADVRDAHDPEVLEIDDVAITPRKADLAVDRVVLAWMPHRLAADGTPEPLG
jgi:hypothetical protein